MAPHSVPFLSALGFGIGGGWGVLGLVPAMAQPALALNSGAALVGERSPAPIPAWGTIATEPVTLLSSSSLLQALPLPLQPPVVISPSPGPDLGSSADHLPVAPQPKATHVVLRLGERRVYVYGGEAILASYPVAIGAPNTPTPTGEYAIFQMIIDPIWKSPWTGEIHEPGPNSALGLRWIGFVTMDNGIIGFHGTPTVNSIGQAASNGCVRLRNEDVVALFDQVQLGMTVRVEP